MNPKINFKLILQINKYNFYITFNNIFFKYLYYYIESVNIVNLLLKHCCIW